MTPQGLSPASFHCVDGGGGSTGGQSGGQHDVGEGMAGGIFSRSCRLFIMFLKSYLEIQTQFMLQGSISG